MTKYVDLVQVEINEQGAAVVAGFRNIKPRRCLHASGQSVQGYSYFKTDARV